MPSMFAISESLGSIDKADSRSLVAKAEFDSLTVLEFETFSKVHI